MAWLRTMWPRHSGIAGPPSSETLTASTTSAACTATAEADQARRLVVRAYRFRQWRLPGGDYRVAAARLTAAGYPTTEQDFKNAGRAKGRLTEHLIPADAEGVRDFGAEVVLMWPDFEWPRLLKGEVENLRDFKNQRQFDVV
jgi:hypothetical protein